MSTKQRNEKKQQARAITRGRASSPALKLVKKDAETMATEAVQSAIDKAFSMPQQPETEVSNTEREAMLASAEPTVAAVKEVSKLFGSKGLITEEQANEGYKVWASGNKQAEESMVLLVRNFQTGRLPYTVVNAVFQMHRAEDSSRAFVAAFRSKCDLSGRTIGAYTFEDAEEIPVEFSKLSQDKTRFLSVKINAEGTALELIAGTRRVAGGSESRIVNEESLSKDYNKLSTSIQTYCDDIATLYASKPLTKLEMFRKLKREVLGLVEFKLVGHCEKELAQEQAASIAVNQTK